MAEATSASAIDQSQVGSSTAGTQADAGAATRSAGAETVTDVGQGEANILNMKKMFDVFLAVDHRIIQNSLNFDEQLKAVALQALANNNALANRVNNGAVDNDVRSKGNDEAYDKGIDSANISEREETIRVGKVADDRTWNIDEVAALIAKNPIYLDALAAAVAAKMAETTTTK